MTSLNISLRQGLTITTEDLFKALFATAMVLGLGLSIVAVVAAFVGVPVLAIASGFGVSLLSVSLTFLYVTNFGR
ncbi:MAG: hypothetical protein Q4A71_01325 [Actinomycetaceae bacterium]|nr:hypothetical protein [Actinomycetaceae bacterium]